MSEGWAMCFVSADTQCVNDGDEQSRRAAGQKHGKRGSEEVGKQSLCPRDWRVWL